MQDYNLIELRKYVEQDANYLRFVSTHPLISGLGLSGDLRRVARNLELIMGRVAKIVAAENAALSKLEAELAAATAATVDPKLLLDTADVSAIEALATANGLDPATGDPLPAAASTNTASL